MFRRTWIFVLAMAHSVANLARAFRHVTGVLAGVFLGLLLTIALDQLRMQMFPDLFRTEPSLRGTIVLLSAWLGVASASAAVGGYLAAFIGRREEMWHGFAVGLIGWGLACLYLGMCACVPGWASHFPKIDKLGSWQREMFFCLPLIILGGTLGGHVCAKQRQSRSPSATFHDSGGRSALR
jgi:MFS family permease